MDKTQYWNDPSINFLCIQIVKSILNNTSFFLQVGYKFIFDSNIKMNINKTLHITTTYIAYICWNLYVGLICWKSLIYYDIVEH